MTNMAYILDGVVILIFLLAIWMGYRRGFFNTIIRLVGCLAAALIAWGISAPLASGIYDSMISSSIQKGISSQIEKTGAQSVDNALEGVIDNLPGAVINALKFFDLGTPDQMKGKLEGSLSDSVQVLSRTIEQRVVRPAAISLLRVLSFFILFVIFAILIGIAASVVGRIFRLPVLRQTDGVLGAVLGGVQGLVLVFVAVSVMSLIATSSDNEDKLTRAVISETIIVHRVEKINPVTNNLYSMFGAKSV